MNGRTTNRESVLGFCMVLGILISKVVCDSNHCRIKLLNDYQSVPDSAFSATSYYVYTNSLEKKTDFSAKAARENYDKENEEFAWCPSNQVEISLSEYLQIDLGRLTIIKVVQTRGRFAQGAGKEFTPFYQIRYSRDNGSDWKDYKSYTEKGGLKKILKGPTDAFLDAFETLDPSIVARIIRIFPYSPKIKRVCLKLQLFGCKFENDLLEYKLLQGSPAIIVRDRLIEQPNNNGYLQLFYDNGYDGKFVDGHLFGGLGLLTDNNIGVDFTNKEKEAFSFIGWNQKRYPETKRLITARFVFVNRRNFTAMKLYSFSKESMEVDYFHKVDISFSDDDSTFREHLQFDNLLNKFNLSHHSIYLNLTGQVGKYVNITIYFHSPWLLLSEVTFFSSPLETLSTENPNLYNSAIQGKHSGHNGSQVTASVIYRSFNNDAATTKTTDKSVSVEIIYLLTILLCLLLGIITAICSFWIIIKKRRSHHRRSMKKQAMALCSHTSFIPYNDYSKSVQCVPSSVTTRSTYPSFTVDRRNYQNESLMKNPHLPVAYIPQSTSLDQNGFMSKQSLADANIYTSILGSDNDSSLSPEYATTSITNDPSLQQSNFDSNSPYLPPPIEPIRPNIFNDSFMDTSDCSSFYYPHINNIPNMQDPSNINFWRFNGQPLTNNLKGLDLTSQMTFNDFSKDVRKLDSQCSQENLHNVPSIYSELPQIHSHY